MRILWAGWGDLGAAAAPALVAAGHEVVAVRRSRIEDPPDGVIGVVGDLHAPDELALPAGVQACVVTLTPDTRDLAGYRHTYLHGLANLHALVQGEVGRPQVPLERLLFVSSTAVYGQDEGEVVDEHTSTSSRRFNGTVMARTEALVASARWPTTVARLSGIYGPGRTRLLDKVRQGRASTDRWTNRIHRDDAAAAIVHLLTRSDAPAVVNVTDTEPATNATVLPWLAARMGRPAPPVDPPDGPGGAPGGKRVDGALLQRTGFVHRYPTFREGYAALVADDSTGSPD